MAGVGGKSMSGGTVIVIKQNRWMKQFEELGATSLDAAVAAHDIRNSDSWLFKRMVSKGVFILTADGRLYMDESEAEQFRRTRRIKMTVGFLVGLAIVAVILILAK
jgi:hypothetical protein